MATRFNAVGDYFLRQSPATLPGIDPFTICMWVNQDNDQNDYATFFIIANATSTAYILMQCDNTSNRLNLVTSAGFSQSSTANVFQQGTWRHVAFVHNGTSMICYVDGVQEISRTDSTSFTIAAMAIGSSTTGYFWDGRIADIKLWTRALSQAEVQVEMSCSVPAFPASLWGWWPVLPGSGERTRDYGGNGRNWTEGGTVTDEARMPASWGGLSPYLFVTTSSGVAIPASASDGLSVGESSSRNKIVPASAADGLVASGSPANQAIFDTAGADGLSLSEIQQALAILQAIANDVSIASDSAVGLATIQGTISDGLVYSDAPSATLQFSGVAVDGLTVGESTIATAILIALANDGLVWGETAIGTIAGGGIIPAGASDGIAFGDVSASLANLVASAGDGLVFAESITAIAQLLAQALDGAAISEQHTRQATFTITASDGIMFTESITTVARFLIAVSDILRIGDIAIHAQVKGEVTITFTMSQAQISFVMKQPGVGFAMKQPSITFERGDQT